MHVTLIAIGKCKNGSIASQLYEEYAFRLKSKPVLIELISKKTFTKSLDQKAYEADLIIGVLPKNTYLIALDEHGKSLSSLQFIAQIKAQLDHGLGNFTFLIGGADGLDVCLITRAQLVLSLGALTWPHMLVRGLLAEQLYRVQQTLDGHPYHRE